MGGPAGGNCVLSNHSYQPGQATKNDCKPTGKEKQHECPTINSSYACVLCVLPEAEHRFSMRTITMPGSSCVQYHKAQAKMAKRVGMVFHICGECRLVERQEK